ncbi:Flp pilus assembly protein CpaB [Rhodobacter sp. Har01]|uniref:Flp pilus assembly protein CpaB n=1 Tax=Rhodobacter sp. Har01 TaxID=2883999 RepID=UPI001D073288|nr:Flp pilus assembly protein CpaB [Rhodobacter sp. Har01]MCB6179669.1 Flp pilus assembly protein CpaB [Rhodobacter sp. Har01]
MRAVFALVLVVGMALAGVAVYMAQNFMSQSQAELVRARAYREKVGKLVEVYATNKALKFGTAITEADVQVIYLQEKFLPEGAFLVPKPPTDASKAAAASTAAKGDATAAAAKSDDAAAAKPRPVLFPENEDKPRFAMRSFEPNEIILATRVTEPGEMAGLTGKLEKGMRAFQIKVDVASGVAGFVMPEDLIDIYWTGSSSGEFAGDVTRLIESAVRVIAVDQASGEGQSSVGTVARTVTVAASPEQVARLAQAQATGRLAMSLVATSDDSTAGLIEVDGNALLGIEQKEVIQVEAPEVCTIKTRKGSEMVDVEIPCTN